MSRKEVYEQTKLFLRDRWVSVFTINAIVYFLTQMVASILISIFFGNALAIVINDFYLSNGVNTLDLVNLLIGYSVLGIIAGIVGNTITAALSMTLLDTYRNRDKLTINAVWKTLKNHFSSIIVVVIIIAFINALTMTLPYVQVVAPLISLLVGLLCSFAYFIIYDEHADGVQAIRKSVKDTRHHRLNMFLILLRYQLIIVSGSLVVLIGLAVSMVGLVSEFIALVLLGLMLILAGGILSLYLKIKYTPYLTVAPVIYYENRIK